MKVKELDVTANIAWSPAQTTPIYLASGTAAQQLDATFSTSSALEIHALNLSDSGHQMPKVTSFPVEHRYHKLIWGSGGMAEGARPNGIICGGLDQGGLTLYDAHKLIQGQHQGSVLATKDKHTGPVQALDFNPFQSNLMASGASESEIYIWDINKLTAPMTPGAKSQPLDDVRCVAWNKQVQHILASCFASRCVVWDLRKSDPIIKVSDSTNRMRSKVVAWHPEVATQLAIASEDDHTPVIQIWDLRLASSPIRTLESHQRGILSIAWCQQDPDLLISAGKDNRILVWNPNSANPGGEVQCELTSSGQWSFDVEWCPRNPAVIASASFDGHVSVYSLMGGAVQDQPSTAIADSFPGMESMKPVQAQARTSVQLKTPPKWLKKPCGASFGFGGKLVTFGTEKPPANQQQPGNPQSSVFLSRVVTDQELISRSQKLEISIQNQNLTEFCDSKIASVKSESDQQIWSFIRANFEDNPRLEFMTLLGFSHEENASEIEQKLGIKVPQNCPNSVDTLTTNLNGLNTTDDKETAFEVIAASNAGKAAEMEKERKPFAIVTDNSNSGVLSKTLLTGNIELAVEICLEHGRTSDALILAAQGGPELLDRTRKKYFSLCTENGCRLIESIVSGEWKEFVEMSNASNWKEALVAVVTYASNEEFSDLCSRIGDKLLSIKTSEKTAAQAAMLCFICAGNLEKLVECWMSTRDTESGSDALQDLVEVVMNLKCAVERMFGHVDIQSGALSAKLAQYASLLASQGALEAALSYLDSNEESIVTLKERLNGAIGRKHSQPTRVAARRKSSGQQHYQQATPSPTLFQPSQPPVFPQQPQQIFNPRRASATPDPGHLSNQAYPNIFNPAAEMPPAPAAPLVADVGGPGHAPPSSNGAGWNDPPPMALNTKPKSQLKMVNAVHPDPITQPLFGSAIPEMSAPPPTSQMNQYGNYGNQGDVYGSAPMPPPQNNNWGGGYPDENQSPASYQPPQQQQQQQMNFMTPAVTNQPANFQSAQQPSAPPARRQPEPPVEKGPIPQEHVVLQEVFGGLRTKCLSAANHPQIRRKLDDVGKKLEILYDKLREGSLPDVTVSGLHRIAAYVRAYDYAACLSVVNDLVSTGSFAVLSEFLPGIKVLLQVSSQLGIYLESNNIRQ